MEVGNLGIILRDPRPLDYSVGAGSLSPLARQIINPRGDWSAYLPVVEFQNNGSYDRYACVTYSLLNCLEVIHLYKTGKSRNFSDRFLAKASNTTTRGNWADTVFDAAKNGGLVDESDYPDTLDGWNEYYKPLSPELIAKAKNFLNEWELYREWIPVYRKDEIFQALKETPLQVFVKYASGDGILNPVGDYNHAVMVYNAVEGEYWEIYDHYTQTRKKYAWNYEFGVVLKPTMILKTKVILMTFKQGYPYLLVEGPEQKLGMYLDGKMVIGEKIDVVLNSAARLKDYVAPIPLLAKDFNSIPHVDLKGNAL